MKAHVNLDALIQRDDFEASTDSTIQQSPLFNNLRVSDLSRDSLFYAVLRKPDFQRETANWTPEKISDLVTSFLNGDLIPSIILWKSPSTGNVFVIDGAHRLSALIAWVHDDFGDKYTSMPFFGENIPDDQKHAAEQTRSLIQKSVGSYADLSAALRDQDSVPKDRLRYARNMSTTSVQLQWVLGESEKAENSFFRINQKATPIDDTELAMIKARRKPNAVAARAFIRAGTGHKYWSSFDSEIRHQIEKIAEEVYGLLFQPSLETSVRTLDLPVAGHGYSADSMRMVFELVNFVNNITPDAWSNKSSIRRKKDTSISDREALRDDTTGEMTLQFMRSVRRAAMSISGNSPGSLGLHPAVYFYTATGNFQPASLLATIRFVTNMQKRNTLIAFTRTRAKFEEFLVHHKHFVNQIVNKYGGLPRAVEPILSMLEIVLAQCAANESSSGIVARLKKEASLSAIKEISDDDRRFGRNFSRETRNVVFMKEALKAAATCGICGARMHKSSMTIDHIKRREDGGLGDPNNGQLAHPYCNSTYKETQKER